MAAALPLAARLGVRPALIECDVENGASRRAIEECGGRPERDEHGTLCCHVPIR